MPSTRRFAAINYGCCTDLAPAIGYIDTARYLDIADALLSIWDQAMLRILRLHLLAAVGLWICHGPASAQTTPADYFTVTPIREAGSNRQELGYAKSKINATSFKQQSLITVAASGGGS